MTDEDGDPDDDELRAAAKPPVKPPNSRQIPGHKAVDASDDDAVRKHLWEFGTGPT